MKRSIFLLALVACVLLGACAPGQQLFTYIPTPAAPAIQATSTPAAQAPTALAPQAVASPSSMATAVPPAPTAAAAAAPAAPERQWQLEDRLPVDPQVRTGVLDNGLTYILRKNSQPKNRAELRLVLNAGSVLEKDDQKGLAHFLEHMLFNGTCRFPKQGIKDFLESNGMRFGADLNAYTSFDETVYRLSVPLDDQKVLNTGLDVLVDWASCATLDKAEMERERGVIVEEHRLRELNAQGRISDQLIEQLLGGSQYAERLPIGDMNIVENAPVETLRSFYKDWYRPDLMSVVAAGDFDLAQVEQLVREKFSAIPQRAGRKDAPPRPKFDVPGFPGTHYLVTGDPENPSTSVQVFNKQPVREFGTVDLYRQTLVEGLEYGMLNQRLEQLIQEGSAPFTSADAGSDNIVRTARVNLLQARTQETSTVPALDALMTEVERAARYGFTATELERQKSILLEGYRRAYNDRTTADSTQLAEEYIRHVLTGEDIPGIAVENQIATQFVPQITLAEINKSVQGLLSPDDRLVFAITPQKQGLTPPTNEQLAAVIGGLASKDIKPYTEQAAATQLMADLPQPADVISTTTIPELGVTSVTLANGVRVVMKPTDFEADEVLFSGISRGGSSLLPESDVPAARLASRIVANSGVAGFTQTQLKDLLAGKSVSVTPSIRELSQRIDGSASPRDLETAFQLINLYVTQPRIDPNAVKAVKDAAAAQLANRDLAPESAMQDAITELQYGNSIRWNPVLPLTATQTLDSDRAFQIYKDRFSDMGGSTFTFVGKFDVAEVTALAQRYLGTLPSKGRVDAWKDLQPAVPAGVHKKDVHKGNEDRAVAEILFPGAFEASPEDQIHLNLISDILNIRLTSELRQMMSATYSPDVGAYVSLWPNPRYLVAVDFSSAPTRTQDLIAATFAQIEDLRTKGPSAEELATSKEQERRSHEEELRHNPFWLGTLTNHALDATQDPRTVLETDALLDKVTTEDVRQAAQRFIKPDQYIQVVLYPAAQ